MIKRGDKKGLSFDPPHILMYFVVLAVVVVLIALVVPKISDNKSDGVKAVENFKEQLSGDLNPSMVSGNVVKSYDFPEGYDELCVVDVSDVDSGDIVDERKIQGSVIKGSLRNVFLFGDDKEVSFYVDGLNLPSFPYYNCVQAEQGSVEMQLSSNGQEVTTKLPVNEKYCTNAQEKTLSDGSNLCGYLDNVYYRGYKGECCREYGYCC